MMKVNKFAIALMVVAVALAREVAHKKIAIKE